MQVRQAGQVGEVADNVVAQVEGCERDEAAQAGTVLDAVVVEVEALQLGQVVQPFTTEH